MPTLDRLGRLVPGALQQHLHQAVGDAEQPDDAGDAAGAGQQAEGDLGQAELRLRVVQRDPAVAGQRDLEAAAERGAVQRGDDGLAERLEPAQVGLDLGDAGGELGRVLVGHLGQQLEVAAGEEGVLRRGDDHAGDRVLLGVEPVDACRQRRAEGVVHRVGALARVVQRQRDDAVGVLVPADGVVSCQSDSLHDRSPRPCRRRRTASPARSAGRARSSSSMTVPRIIAPVAPSGWPSAIAPPLTLTFSCGTSSVLHELHDDGGEGLVDLEQVDVVEGRGRPWPAPCGPTARGR